MEVPEIPGYHLHWMMGNPGRIAQALRAGYTFVEADETTVVNADIAGGAFQSGSTDMGSRVSVLAAKEAGEDGKEQRLYLMKIPLEHWEEDQKALESRSEQIAATIRGGGELSQNNFGSENRYISDMARGPMANLFTRKSRRA